MASGTYLGIRPGRRNDFHRGHIVRRVDRVSHDALGSVFQVIRELRWREAARRAGQNYEEHNSVNKDISIGLSPHWEFF